MGISEILNTKNMTINAPPSVDLVGLTASPRVKADGGLMPPMVSYAQNFEDVMLRRALQDIESGFYIDIGAGDPDLDTVTRYFYDIGWRGINLEPDPRYFPRLEERRPEDTNIQCAVGAASENLIFNITSAGGLSTGNGERLAEIVNLDHLLTTPIVVPAVTLDQVFMLTCGKDVEFLKVDVEGMEADILNTTSLDQCRPKIIVVEATIPNTQHPSHQMWEPILLGKGYRFAWFDGLNRFYVRREDEWRLSFFEVPPCYFDNFLALTISTRVKEVAEGETEALQRSLAERDAEADRLREEMAAATEALQQSLAERDAEADRLREEMAAATEALQQSLAERDAEAERLREEMAAATEALQQSLAERDADAERLREAMAAATARAEALQRSLAERDADAERLREAMAAATARAVAMQRSLAERDADAEHLREQRAAADKRAGGLREILAEQMAASATRAKDAEAAGERAAALQQTLAERDADLQRVYDQLAAVDKRADGLREILAEQMAASATRAKEAAAVVERAAALRSQAERAADARFQERLGKLDELIARRAEAFEAAIVHLERAICHRKEPPFRGWLYRFRLLRSLAIGIPRGRRATLSALNLIADLARDARHWEIAAKFYREFLDLAPGTPGIWVQYGHALKEAGNVAEAEDAYGKALNLEGDNADTHLQLGHALKLQGRLEEAGRAYSRALELAPKLHNAREELRNMRMG